MKFSHAGEAVKLSRLMRFSEMSRMKCSTMFSLKFRNFCLARAPMGARCKTKRECLASHACRPGCECVA